MTSAIESEIQSTDGMLYHPRLLLGMRTYKKKKDRPKEIKVTFIQANESTFKKKIPIEAAADLLMLPMFVAPRSLVDVPPWPDNTSIDVSGTEQAEIGDALHNLLQRHGAKGIRGRVRIPVGAFIRFLCKIAYGFHVVDAGEFPREESPALALLLENRGDVGNWVGSKQIPLDQNVELSDKWHEIKRIQVKLANGDECDAVSINLFSFKMPCTYIVITRYPGFQDMVA